VLPNKPRKKRFLVDVDDVLCDFKTPVIALIQELFGIEVVLEELHHWDVFALLTEEQRIILFREISRPGYCAGLLPNEGAQDAIEELRQVVDVVVATRPFISPTWVYERMHWLIDHFGFTEHTIINTAAKHMIRGDALLDDNPENVLAWKEEHPQGAGLLWATPNTENMRQCDHFRVRTWPEVLIRVKAL
jgi:5'(3')-deoxyribonucleotidase